MVKVKLINFLSLGLWLQILFCSVVDVVEKPLVKARKITTKASKQQVKMFCRFVNAVQSRGTTSKKQSPSEL